MARFEGGTTETRGGRQLEADRLAEAGREHNQAVTAVKRGLHCGDLLRPEAIEPPVLLERGEQVCTGVAVGQSNAAQAFARRCGVANVQNPGIVGESSASRARSSRSARAVWLGLGEAPRTLGDARRRLATLWRRCATVARRFPQTLGLAVLFRICTRRGRQANTDPTTQARTQDTGLHNGRQAPQEEQEAAHLRRVVVRVARRVGRHTCCSGHDAGGHTSFCSVAGGRPATRGRPTTHTHGGFAAAPRVHGVP